MDKSKGIAIIPARGGSKRIPKKNIKNFCGKPIIQYSIKAAIESNLFQRVIVSTDCKTIANISQDSGAEVPFMRYKETSDDHSTLGDVLFETVNRLGISIEKDLSYICCILPTSPFLTSSFLKRSQKRFIQDKYHAFFPVKKYSYPIWRSLKHNKKNETYSMIWPQHLNTRSQDLDDVFHDAGMFYFLDIKEFLKEKSVFLSKNGSIEISPWFVQDIDNNSDWEYAEIKFKLLHSLNKTL